MSDEKTTPDSENEPTDIFNWANQTDSVKNDLEIELFLFNKFYTPFVMKFSSELTQQIRALFLYDPISFANLGAGTGLSVREFEMSEAEENVLLRTELGKIEKASKLLHVIESERTDIAEFNEEEHEFKRMKGIIARFSKKDSKEPSFYIAKLLQTSAALKGAVSWEINGGRFDRFKADVGLKIPADNQVLIVDKDIFVFSQSKFERLFEYDYKKQALADRKVSEIESKYKLSFPEGVDLQSLVKDRKKTVNKLQKLDIGEVTQEQALEYADDMQLELMTDEEDRIIIMDGNDLDTFVSLINEDYITSAVTGKRYEIKSKKLLDEPAGGEPPRG
ncbi:MAG TPA: Kiwa anti-phage protein KwaB-like domain-containing protein [Candidatus Saccharimonadales bacterium]